MKKLTLITIFFAIFLFISCSSTTENSNGETDPLCEYKPGIGGCEDIYFDGNKCVIINEGQCKPNEFQKFQTLDECRNLCE